MYPNSLQIFHSCCIRGNEREKLRKTDIKLLLENAGNN
jgi:hypothetical protein